MASGGSPPPQDSGDLSFLRTKRIGIAAFAGGFAIPYTIKQAAELTNLTPVTLRYYEKQGLLPFVKRRESGYREFSDDDIAMLRVIECLKKSGMSIREIRQFSEWVLAGDESLQERYEMFLGRKKAVEAQLAELQETLDFIDRKCWYYETAIEAGTEKIHFNGRSGELPCEQESTDSAEK